MKASIVQMIFDIFRFTVSLSTQFSAFVNIYVLLIHLCPRADIIVSIKCIWQAERSDWQAAACDRVSAKSQKIKMISTHNARCHRIAAHANGCALHERQFDNKELIYGVGMQNVWCV